MAPVGILFFGGRQFTNIVTPSTAVLAVITAAIVPLVVATSEGAEYEDGPSSVDEPPAVDTTAP